MQGRNFVTPNAINTKQLKLMKSIGPTQGDILIQLNYKPEDHSTDLLSLPLNSVNNYHIRYIIPYYEVERADPDMILEKVSGDWVIR